MRVLLWSPKGAGVHYGGPGTSAFRLYRLAGEAMEVDLAHGFFGQPEYPSVFRRHHQIYPIFNADMGEARFGPGPKGYRYARFLQRGKSWLTQHASEYDVFHGLTGYAYTVGAALRAERLGLPAAIKIAGYRRDLADKRRIQSITGRIHRRREALKRITATVAISRHIRDELLDYGLPPEKVVYIPNGVDVARFHPADEGQRREIRCEMGWEDRFTILYVASLVGRKRPDVLIAALAEIRARGADAQLVLVGPDQEPKFANWLRQEAERLGVSDRVKWLGMITDMPPVYRAADVFALPSRVEGMSNAVLEAMASGLPVLAEPISGNEDLVDGENGVLVGGGGPEYADFLMEYHRDARLRSLHAGNARLTIIGRFDSETVLKAHEEMFRRMIDGADPAGASLDHHVRRSVAAASDG